MNILKYLPEFIAGLKQFDALYGANGAITKALNELKADVEKVKNSIVLSEKTPLEFFVRVAKSYGCYKTDNKNELLQIINTKVSDRRPYNEQKLNEFLAEIVGEGNFDIKIVRGIFAFENPDAPISLPFYRVATKLTVALNTSSESVYKAVSDMLDRILPLDIMLEIGTFDGFRTYNDVSNYTYKELTDFKYAEIRRINYAIHK